MKVSAVFTDYDGTIAPLGVERERSAVPGALFSVLEEISSRIPVAVITSKDVGFVRPRTAFAWAWAGVLGLELRFRDGSGSVAKVPADLNDAMSKVRELLPSGVFVEEKRGSDGSLLGVSLDWKRLQNPPLGDLGMVARLLEDRGLPVHSHPEHRFMDVYAAPADKGTAFKALVEALGVHSPIMYLGDTVTDNDAFDVSDIPVCVGQRVAAKQLRCLHSIRYDEVEGMFSRLLADGLDFTVAEGGSEAR